MFKLLAIYPPQSFSGFSGGQNTRCVKLCDNSVLWTILLRKQSNANSVTGPGKRKAPTCKLIIWVPWSCFYYYTPQKDLEEGNNSPVMESRASHNLNMANDKYDQLGASKLWWQTGRNVWSSSTKIDPNMGNIGQALVNCSHKPYIDKTLWER